MKSATKAKAGKPKRRKPTKTQLLSEAEDLLRRIEAQVDECDKAEFELLRRKEAAKRQKEVLGNHKEELAKLVRARKESHPLFEGKEAGNGEAKAVIDGDTEWKLLPVSALNLKPRQRKALEDAGLTTLGKLTAHMNGQGQWWGREIKGLGEKGQEAVSDAFVEFWAMALHPEYTQAQLKSAGAA